MQTNNFRNKTANDQIIFFQIRLKSKKSTSARSWTLVYLLKSKSSHGLLVTNRTSVPGSFCPDIGGWSLPNRVTRVCLVLPNWNSRRRFKSHERSFSHRSGKIEKMTSSLAAQGSKLNANCFNKNMMTRFNRGKKLRAGDYWYFTEISVKSELDLIVNWTSTVICYSLSRTVLVLKLFYQFQVWLQAANLQILLPAMQHEPGKQFCCS